MTPRQLRDSANRPWDTDDGFLKFPCPCPSCGAELIDMRGSGFNVRQAAEAGLCVYIGNGDYTCSVKQLARDFR